MTSDTIILLFIVVIAAAVLTVASVALLMLSQNRRLRDERAALYDYLERDAQRQGRSLAQTSREVSRLGGALDSRMDELSRSGGEQLAQMRALVGDGLSRGLNDVDARLRELHRGLGELKGMGDDIARLRRVMGNVKTRGIWGEMMLKGILEEMFAPEQYVENAAIPADSDNRVEFALKLTDSEGGCVLLPMDSKFPQEDYLRLAQAQEDNDREAVVRARRKLEQALTAQAATIAEKYIRPPQTVDFALMFLPAESLYAEAAAMDGFIERMQTKHRVLIAGPATLCALLTALRTAFRSQQLSRRSGDAIERLEALREDCARLTEEIIDARRQLGRAGAAVDRLEARVRAMEKRTEG